MELGTGAGLLRLSVDRSEGYSARFLTSKNAKPPGPAEGGPFSFRRDPENLGFCYIVTIPKFEFICKLV